MYEFYLSCANAERRSPLLRSIYLHAPVRDTPCSHVFRHWFDDKDATERIRRESWGNVLHGLLETNIFELCFECMPSGLDRRLKIAGNAMLLAGTVVRGAMYSGHLRTVQTRCIRFLDQEATKYDGCSSLFFAIQSIINNAIAYIKQNKKFGSLKLQESKKSGFGGLKEEKSYELILPQPLKDVKSMFKLVRHLCAHRFRPMQLLLLRQPNIVPAVYINALELTNRLLGTITDTALQLSKKDLQEQLPVVLPQVKTVVKFLTLTVQGPCSPNQVFLANSALVKHVNRILALISPLDYKEETGEKCQESIKLCTSLYSNVLRLLSGLFEGRTDIMVEKKLIDEMWFDGIVAYVWDFQQRQKRLFPNITSSKSQTRADLIYKMRRTASYCGVLWLKLVNVQPKRMQKKMKHIEDRFTADAKARQHRLPQLLFAHWVDKYVVTIEIYWKTDSGELSNGRLVNEHFMIPKLAMDDKKRRFDEMRAFSDLTSTEAKLEHFLNFVKILNGRVRHEERLRTTCECASFFLTAQAVRFVSNVFLALTIFNFTLVLVSFQYDAQVMQEYSDVNIRYVARQAVAYEPFHCAITDLTWWIGDPCVTLDIITSVMLIIAMLHCALKLSVEGVPIYVYEKEENALHTLLSTPVLSSIFKICWVQFTPAHWVIVLLIVEVFFYIPSAGTVCKSVIDPIAIWLAAIVLIAIVIFLFSIIVFQFYHKDFFENHKVCQTLITCFLECFNYGMRNGGGLGDSLWAYDFRSHPQTWTMRAIVDLVFFLFVNVILLNVVFGVIIDKFGEFRDTKISQDFDRENVCFICGKDRAEISAFTDFNEHIMKQHNLIDYWRYIVYLQESEEKYGRQLMTGLQHHVLSLVDKDSFDWFPVGRLLADPKSNS